jgi:proteasome lid subunit RPN8/RPN11
MTVTAAGNFAIWSAPELAFRIEYSAAVLEQIREISVDGYHRLPRGGVETGGVLFGTHQEDVVRIVAWREAVCEYAKGPSFLLSPKDEAALEGSLESWRGDAELARLEPVGWYRAHTRSEVALSDADMAFFNRFFPRPWQIGLIVRPASFAPTRAGFFFREADGSIRAQSSYLEFTLVPLGTSPMPRATEARAAPVEAPALLPATVAEPQPVSQTEPPILTRLDGGRWTRWKWYAAGLAVAAAAVAGFWWLKPSQHGLTLSATDLGRQQLRIAWDGTSPAIGHARSGSIEIDDHGVRTQVTLTPTDLRSGSLFYERQSGDVAVRLTVDAQGDQPVVEATRFLRPGETVAAPAPRQDAAKQPAPELHPPATGVPEEIRARTAAPAPPLTSPAPAKPARHIYRFRPPPSLSQQASANVPSIAPPEIENLPANEPAGLSSVLKVAPVATTAPAAPRPPPTAPASGRIVWTGKLAKNGRLVIERNRASSGVLTGALPAAAVRVSAYPGSRSGRGITLFTGDPRYSQPVTEKAGAENGGNATTYTWDPRHAGGIRIVEQPGPRNDYTLVLESDIPKLSVLMIEWRAAQ